MRHGLRRARRCADSIRRALISRARAWRLPRWPRPCCWTSTSTSAQREIVTLIGPNGAGKTTLVRVLLGLEKPDRGTVRRREDLRIGYVPQRFDVDARHPDDGRALPGARQQRQCGRRIGEVLAEVGAQSRPQQQLGELSGGELQRVLLARALLRKPNLLVLDEPVRGVDYAGEAELYTLIGRLRDERGFGVLLVSHDLHVVMARATASSASTGTSAARACRRRSRSIPSTRACSAPRRRAPSAVYHHHHDHRHDLAGEPQPARGETAAEPARGDD